MPYLLKRLAQVFVRPGVIGTGFETAVAPHTARGIAMEAVTAAHGARARVVRDVDDDGLELAPCCVIVRDFCITALCSGSREARQHAPERDDLGGPHTHL